MIMATASRSLVWRRRRYTVRQVLCFNNARDDVVLAAAAHRGRHHNFAAITPMEWRDGPRSFLALVDRRSSFSSTAAAAAAAVQSPVAAAAAATNDCISYKGSSSDQPDVTTTTSDPPATRKRKKNADLENIIRQGIVYLNQTALAIQQHPHTQKNLFGSKDGDGAEDDAPHARQLYEEHRIYETAVEILEQICDKNPSHALIVAGTGDPITLLRVEVNVTNTHADLIWTLPYSVLSQIPDMRQRMILQSAMEKRLLVQPHGSGNGGGGGGAHEFLHRIHASLMQSSYSPRVRLKAADLMDVQEMMNEMDDDN
jgi:hypothetical protein